MKTENKKRIWLLAVIPLVAVFATLIQCKKNEDKVDPEEITREAEPEEIFEFVDVEPEFVGGQMGMSNYIVENITYPQAAKDRGAEGIVYVSFVITKTGELIDATIRKGVDADLDKEAVRVISGMPDWKPGELDGKTVAVKFTVPIHFRLS